MSSVACAPCVMGATCGISSFAWVSVGRPCPRFPPPSMGILACVAGCSCGRLGCPLVCWCPLCTKSCALCVRGLFPSSWALHVARLWCAVVSRWWQKDTPYFPLPWPQSAAAVR